MSIATATVTENDYLAFERQALDRHEYRDGVIVERASSNRDHCLIAGNIASAIHTQIRDTPFELYQSAMRVRVARASLIAYPDVVVCREPEFLDDQRDVLLNPTLLIEVLSESTAAYDCGVKARHYRQLESLQEFLLIDSRVATLEHYVREDAETWRITGVDGLEAVVSLKSIGCELPLAEAYAKVQLHADAKSLLQASFRSDPERHR